MYKSCLQNDYAHTNTQNQNILKSKLQLNIVFASDYNAAFYRITASK